METRPLQPEPSGTLGQTAVALTTAAVSVIEHDGPLIAAIRQLGSDQVLEGLADAELEVLQYQWDLWARPAAQLASRTWTGQLPPPGDWVIWLVQAGRNFGKSRLAGEWVRNLAETHPGIRIALVGATFDAVMSDMVEGESGIIACCPPWNMPELQVAKKRLLWRNGAKAIFLTADAFHRFRGKTFHAAWCDELCFWSYPEAWDLLRYCVRLPHGKSCGLGECCPVPSPRLLVTTTPTPNNALLRDIRAEPHTVVTSGSTHDNAAHADKDWLERNLKKFAGTDLERQEIFGEMLESVAGALWDAATINEHRVREDPGHPAYPVPLGVDLVRIVVAVDPASTATKRSALAGIVVAGLGSDGHVYVLDDLTARLSPKSWASRAATAFHRYEADCIVVERSHGEFVRDAFLAIEVDLPIKEVTAKRGKFVRAEPVAAMYQAGRVHHVGGAARPRQEGERTLAYLETQLCSWDPTAPRVDHGLTAEPGLEPTPDRLDALVYAVKELALQHDEGGFSL